MTMSVEPPAVLATLTRSMRDLLAQSHGRWVSAAHPQDPVRLHHPGGRPRAALINALAARKLIDQGEVLNADGARAAAWVYEQALDEDAARADEALAELGVRRGWVVMTQDQGVARPAVLVDAERYDPMGLRSVSGPATRVLLKAGPEPVAAERWGSVDGVRPLPLVRAADGGRALELSMVELPRRGQWRAFSTVVTGRTAVREVEHLPSAESALAWRSRVAEDARTRWGVVRGVVTVARMERGADRKVVRVGLVPRGFQSIVAPAGVVSAAEWATSSTHAALQRDLSEAFAWHVTRGWRVRLVAE